MAANDEEARRADEAGGSQGTTFPVWAIRLASAAASAIGLSGLLYASGFLATRSHQTFWGLWGGPAEEAAGIVSEGGRFFYHLAFVLIDLLNPLSSGVSVGFYAVCIAGLSLWAVPTVSLRGILARRTMLARTLRVALPLAPALATYAWGWMLLQDLATVIAPASLLTLEGVAPPALAKLVCRPTDIYFARVIDWIALGVLFAASVWALRLANNNVTRIIAWLGGLFFLAAASLLPAAYGRLVLLPDYPQIEFARDEGTPVERVLIRAAGPQWVVWNLAARKTEVISLRQNESVVIGSRRVLTIPNTDRPKGDGCGTR